MATNTPNVDMVDMPVISRAAYREGDTLHAIDLLLDGSALAFGQCLHSAQFHCAGVVAGFQTIDIRQVTSGSTISATIALSPGAALDQSGQLLLWSAGQQVAGPWPSPGDGDLHVWLFLADEQAHTQSCCHNDEASNVHEISMKRAAPTIEVRLAVSPMKPESHVGHVYLGAYSKRPSSGHGSLWNYASGRTYVGARGEQIDGCSGDTRLLLGPEQPRDMRRFAVTCQVDKAFQNVMTWETNHTFNLHSPAQITREGSQRSELVVRNRLRFGGAIKGDEADSLPWAMQLVEVEEDGRRIQELRITVSKPDDEKLQIRNRCSLGRTQLKTGEIPQVLQTGASLGVLSILGDGSVEVVGDLWVYADRENHRPGLILRSASKGETSVPTSQPQIVTDALVVYFAAIWSADKKSLAIVTKADSNQAVHTLRLLVTLIDLGRPNLMPVSHDFPLADIIAAGKPVASDVRIDLPPSFSTDIRVDVFVLGITAESKVAQFHGQSIPTMAPT